MKKLLIAVCLISGCAKEPIEISIGKSYHIKNNIFNKGAYQPKQPVTVNSLYIDPSSGLPYANVTDQNGTIWYIPKDDLK